MEIIRWKGFLHYGLSPLDIVGDLGRLCNDEESDSLLTSNCEE